MPWVPNLAFPGEAIDKPYRQYNRTVATDPQGTLTPEYAGERVVAIDTGTQYMALGLADNTWVESGPAGPD